MSNKDLNQKIGEDYGAWSHRILTGIAAGTIKMKWLDACILLGMKWDVNRAKKLGEEYLKKDQERDAFIQQQEAELKEDADWNAMDEKTFELEKKKIQMYDQRRMLKKEIRNMARAEYLVQKIDDAIHDSVGTIPFDRDQLELIKMCEVSDNEGALLLSDWHKGQTSANHWNLFNDVIFKNRIESLVRQTLIYGEQNHLKKLHVFVLGDLINGLIHVSTRINNEENVIRQTIQVSEVLSEVLCKFAEHFDTYVYFSRGNHDRVSANKKEEIFSESFFDVIQYFVSSRISSDHPTLHIMKNEIDPEIIHAKIAGHTVFGVHGHKDRPEKVTATLPTFMKEIPEFIFMGHYHAPSEREVNGIEVITNGCLCGTDDFAVSIRRNASPCQKLLILNPEGHVCTYNLMLGNKNSECEEEAASSN